MVWDIKTEHREGWICCNSCFEHLFVFRCWHLKRGSLVLGFYTAAAEYIAFFTAELEVECVSDWSKQVKNALTMCVQLAVSVLRAVGSINLDTRRHILSAVTTVHDSRTNHLKNVTISFATPLLNNSEEKTKGKKKNRYRARPATIENMASYHTPFMPRDENEDDHEEYGEAHCAP